MGLDPMTDRPHVFDLDPDALRSRIADLGMAGFRAEQVIDWVYRKHTADPREMTNLSKADRERLAETIDFTRGRVVRRQQATDGTEKLLVSWPPPSATTDSPVPSSECVMIPAASHESGKPRRTACISTQVGCPVGCRFCASGLGGLEANLTAGQIVEQVFHLNALGDPPDAPSNASRSKIADSRSQITHVVFMGMGEPLANFRATAGALRRLTADWAFGLSARRITVSTVGLPAPIRRLADLRLPVTLAISLHAPSDPLRRELIPWARRTRIDSLIDAGRYYFARTGREVTLEYILLGGVNDRPTHARQLADVAARLRSNINLIRYNEVAGLPYRRPSDDDVRRFQQTLREAKANVHLRASRGRDIAAACGQLRHEARTVPGG